MRIIRTALSVLILALIVAAAASAAFPGRNGFLAVAPVTGPGLLLVTPSGHAHRICPIRGRCQGLRNARWSPDGRAIAYTTRGTSGSSIVYSDGSCLDCEPFGGSHPAFMGNSTVLSVVAGGRLTEYGEDGIAKGSVSGADLIRHASDQAWSAQGDLVAVRSGRLFVGRPPHALRLLGAGTGPSWSPDGSRLAVSRGGWVTVLDLRHHSSRPLVRGSAPAWSPDGKLIAFVAAGHRLSVIRSSGGRVRRLGNVRAVSVDWQPVPPTPAPGCGAPPGSTTFATSQSAVVTSDSADTPGTTFGVPAYMGCLRATGRARLLVRFDFQTEDSTTIASDAALSGNDAALVVTSEDPHYGGSSESVSVFDLRSGASAPELGGEQAGCMDYSYACGSAMNQLLLGPTGFTAVRTTVIENGGTQTEQIIASDSSGPHVLDTVTGPYIYTGQRLDLLRMTGNTVVWLNVGTYKSATLQ
jgi:hypothetical protein